jgi:hypothetical protein
MIAPEFGLAIEPERRIRLLFLPLSRGKADVYQRMQQVSVQFFQNALSLKH